MKLDGTLELEGTYRVQWLGVTCGKQNTKQRRQFLPTRAGVGIEAATADRDGAVRSAAAASSGCANPNPHPNPNLL